MAPEVSPSLYPLVALQLLTLAAMPVALVRMLLRLWAGQPIFPQVATGPRHRPFTPIDGMVLTWVAVTGLLIALTVFRAGETAVKPGSAPPEAEQVKERKGVLTASMVLVSVVNALIVVGIPVAFFGLSGVRPRALGLGSDDWGRDLKVGVFAFLWGTPLVYGVFLVAQAVWPPTAHPLERMIRQELSPAVVVLAFLSAVVLAPMAEELQYRGFVQSWLTRLFMRPGAARLFPRLPRAGARAPQAYEAVGDDLEVETWLDPYRPPRVRENQKGGDDPGLETAAADPAATVRAERLALVTTSLLFAAVHAPEMPAPFALFALSLILGTLANRTGNLVAPIVLHALFNGFATVGLLIRVLSPPA